MITSRICLHPRPCVTVHNMIDLYEEDLLVILLKAKSQDQFAVMKSVMQVSGFYHKKLHH
jgi:hypothetical protein